MNSRIARRILGAVSWRYLTTRGFLASLLGVLCLSQSSAQPLRFDPPTVSSPVARIVVEGVTNRFVRLDTSIDLGAWQPFDLLSNTSGLLEFFDPEAAQTPHRFFRAVEIEPQSRVTGLSSNRGRPGGSLEIFGELFARGQPGDNVVLVGGKVATVLSASGARLVVQLPPDATSGDVVVVTPNGVQRAPENFTITTPARVEWALPPGVADRSLEVVGAYGSAIRQGDDSLTVETRLGKPQVMFAIPRDTLNLAFFAAVSEGSPAPIHFSAASTAEALVFLHPRFQTLDPVAAVQRMAIIRADPKVSALGAVIVDLWPRGGDPFTQPALVTAYREAITSASQSLAGLAPASDRSPGVRLHAPTALTWELDPEYIRFQSGLALRDSGGNPLSVGVSAVEHNPVDWIVVAHEVDVEAAFPKGEDDLRKASQAQLTLGLNPLKDEGYPLRSGYEQRRTVGAELLFSNFHIISELLERAAKLVFDEAGPELFVFPNHDAVYLIRAVSPAVPVIQGAENDAEQAFLLANREGLRDTYRLAQAVNLLAAALDLLSASFDVAEELDQLDRTVVQEGLLALALQAAGDASTWQGADDVIGTMLDLAGAAANFIGTKVAEKGLESAAKKAAGSFGKAAGLASGLLTFLDVAGTFGEVYERGLGFIGTTPLESSFVVVGNPFRLDVVSITPAGGTPGDTLDVVIRKARFDAAEHDGDKVFITSTNGAAPFFARVEVLSTTDLAGGQQRLKVRLPDALNGQPDGPHRLHVRAQGRSGEIEFQLVGRPVIEKIEPTEGFAAVDSFLGQPFTGSAVRVRGLGFGPEDQILFGGVETTNKSGSAGNVLALVPRGAGSGAITVRRRVATNDVRETIGPRFTVLGSPTILSASPASGPVGTRLGLTVGNLGVIDAASGHYAVVQLAGGLPSPLARLGNMLLAIIPFGISTGLTEVAVFTPAGQTKTTFLVEEGRAPGAEITVGLIGGCAGPTNSPVTLAAALDIASGKNLPEDDPDIRRRLVNNSLVLEEVDLNCEWEQGDFVNPDLGFYAEPGSVTPREDMLFRWPVGAANADTILVTEGTGEISGEFVFGGSYDTLSLDSLGGSLRLTGTNNTFTVRSFKGTRLVIEGSHNKVTGTFELAEGVTILGHQNEFSGTVSKSQGDGVVVNGDFNEIRVTAIENTRDGVVIDGGQLNRVTAATGRNGGNGVTLRGGASGNQVSVGTGVPFGPGVQPGSGNSGHGVLVTGGAKSNFIRGISPIGGNGGDGVRLEGNGLEDNLLEILDAVGNAGNGFTLGAGAVGTRIPTIIARNNGGDGVHLAGARETSAFSIRSGFNSGNGLSISGVNDGVSEIGMLHLNGNRQAGLRLAGGTKRLRLEGLIESGAVGLRLEGSSVVSNLLQLEIRGCSSHGTEINGANQNRLWLDVRNCGGHGVLTQGAGTNEFDLYADNNKGDGLRMQASHGNLIQGRFLRNQSGVVVAEGSANNTLQGLQSNANRDHGVHLTGAATRGQTVASVSLGSAIADEPAGNAGDGLRIDEGASGNFIGVPDQDLLISGSGAAGLRVAGATTTANRIVNAVFSSAAVGLRQPAAIIVESGATDTVIGGPEAGEHIFISGNVDGIVLRSGARGTAILNCEVTHQSNAGIRVLDASDNLIGGAGGPGVLGIVPGLDGGIPPITWGNLVTANKTGLEIAGAASRNNAVRANTFIANETGVLVAGAASTRIDANGILENTQHGIELNGAVETRLNGNVITDNASVGVRLAGGTTMSDLVANRLHGNQTGVEINGVATRRNRLSANTISGNTGRGIVLLNGANDGRATPQIESFSSQSVTGTVSAPDGSTVEVYADPVGDFDEGHSLLAFGRVFHGRFNARLKEPLRPAEVGKLFGLNATVTDPDRNTSEFGGTVGGGGAGSLMAFTSTRDGNAELYLAQGLFNDPLRLTIHTASDAAPAFSPDGTKLAFVSTRDGNAEIYVMTLGGTNPIVRLTNQSALEGEPAWSPDGTKIVFVSERDGNPELYRMNADGSNVTRLITDPGNDNSPAFSPDGLKLSFASNRSGQWDIWTMNADGSGAQPLASHAAAETEPSWSPDGQRIAFVSDRDGNPEIYTVRLDGSELRRLTNHASVDNGPTWLAGGGTLVFSSNRDAGFELYLISSEGGSPDRLTVSGDDNLQPTVPR